MRVDDHADDYMTDPNVVILPGESITATIDSDVSPTDPGLNAWDWKISPPLRPGGKTDDVMRPRRGIESLDDRDVFRYRISAAGTYRLSVSDQPTGLGVWFVWHEDGNLWLSATTGPAESYDCFHEPGTYYVEIGTPYDSDGNTGTYTVSVDAVTDDDAVSRSEHQASEHVGVAIAN